MTTTDFASGGFGGYQLMSLLPGTSSEPTPLLPEASAMLGTLGVRPDCVIITGDGFILDPKKGEAYQGIARHGSACPPFETITRETADNLRARAGDTVRPFLLYYKSGS